jgi:hypothetical protein
MPAGVPSAQASDLVDVKGFELTDASSDMKIWEGRAI